MLLLFTIILMTMPAVALAAHFASRLLRLNASALAVESDHQSLQPADAERYRPMLRLLSSDDLQLAGGALATTLRRERIQIFRDYLRCITKDYGRLLSAVRAAMVSSQMDRPDLAAALYRYQFSFAYALCRIELSLTLYRFGVGAVDCSGLVNALAHLRSEALVLAPSQAPAN